jgi:exopolyphosphatase / guanosine-5'-triphosphate,3'-diphosphate pyrophosphatase
MPRILASADIGSNTVHLLVAETDGKRVRRLANRSEWLGLGESVARFGSISDAQSASLSAILKEYRQVAAANRAQSFYVFATEAVRAAANHAEVLKKIHRDTKIWVEVIPPVQEAEWSYQGSRLDCDAGPNLLLFEVGGGSAQVALIRDYRIAQEMSLPLGTGRIVAETSLESPSTPDSVEAARRYIRGCLSHWRTDESIRELPVVASGGVVRGLWRAVHPDGDKSLALEELRYIGWSASKLSVSQIATRFACKLKRAATLLPGALVYEELFRHAGIQELMVSEYGVREGAVLAMDAGAVSLCRA